MAGPDPPRRPGRRRRRRDDGPALAEAGADGPTYTLGFCIGGSQSWRLAASDVDLVGMIGFHGRPQLVDDVAERMHRRTLLLVAGDDAATSSGRARHDPGRRRGPLRERVSGGLYSSAT